MYFYDCLNAKTLCNIISLSTKKQEFISETLRCKACSISEWLRYWNFIRTSTFCNNISNLPGCIYFTKASYIFIISEVLPVQYCLEWMFILFLLNAILWHCNLWASFSSTYEWNKTLISHTKNSLWYKRSVSMFYVK